MMRCGLSYIYVSGLFVACVFGSSERTEAAFGINVIANPGAEAGAGSTDGSVVAVPSWITTSVFTVVKYDSPGGFPISTDPGPPDRGLNFFAGGQLTASSSASQLIDETADAAQIDAGNVTFDLSGYLGGFWEQQDNAVLSATFLSANNTILGMASIGPVTAEDRISLTGMLRRSTTGAVPIGTRMINVNLQMTRLDFNFNDGYADNLSLTFRTVPEPLSIALLSIGTLGLICCRRWRHQHG